MKNLTDTRNVCIPCSLATGKVIRFFPKQNGYNVNYGFHSILSGDLYECSLCGSQHVTGFAKSPDHGDHKGSARKYVHPAMEDITDSDGLKLVKFVLYDDHGNVIKYVRIPDTYEAKAYTLTVNSAHTLAYPDGVLLDE